MNALPVVDFCGLQLSRLLIGANPFGGYSHQNEERDAQMRAYYTPDRIVETLRLAEDEGITGMVANNETPHVLEAVERYHREGGRLQWIAQLNCMHKPDMEAAIDEALAIGAKAVYFHGALIDSAFANKDEAKVRRWFAYGQSRGVPTGAAAHDPRAHLWLNELEIADFHTVCFFNCGSLHQGGGEKFSLRDVFPAVQAIQTIQKPCIAYKVLGAGRMDARMGLEFAYESIKPGDVVNLGMHRGDADDIVAQNASLVRDILAPSS
jgi:hypothetical protein